MGKSITPSSEITQKVHIKIERYKFQLLLW